MRNSAADASGKAKRYALLLLKFRVRSEKEMAGRLKEKKFAGPVVKNTLAFLKKNNLINDADFARLWIQARIGGLCGLDRLKEELRAKGVAARIIERELKKAGGNYKEEDTVARLAVEQLASMGNLEPQKAKRRLFAYLARRGFSQEIIEQVIHKVGEV